MGEIFSESVFPLPRALENITPSWITKALGINYPNVSVSSVRAEPVNRGTCTVVRLFLVYNSAGCANPPSCLILKGGFEPHSDQLNWIISHEARFYTDVQPYITMNSPKCYFAATDPNNHQSIIILEDLTLRNVQFLHGSNPLDFTTTASRLRALAVYHAETWESPYFSAGSKWDWIEGRFGRWFTAYMQNNMSDNVWQRYMAMPQGAAVSTRLHNVQWARKAFDMLHEIERRGPTCLIHGDTHLGNSYLDADGKPGFFDPSVCRAHWSIEVAYCIVGSLDIADRRNWERGLLAIYIEELARGGVSAPSFEEAYDSYRCSIFMGYLYFVVNSTDFQPSVVNTRGSMRFGMAALDNGTIERLS